MNKAIPLFEFDVLVRTAAGEQRLERVLALSAQLAVKAAEHAVCGTAVLCVETMRVLGRCTLCTTVLFDRDRPSQVRPARDGRPAMYRCRDC